jgi:hypothetical protein
VESILLKSFFLYRVFFASGSDMWHSWDAKCIQAFCENIMETDTLGQRGLD